MKETRYLISSADEARLDALGPLDSKRGYRAIEASLHQRLDVVLDEDESRVRGGGAVHILGMCRRLAVSLACAWRHQAKTGKKNCRKSTRDFQDHLTAHDLAAAFALVTANNPTAWLPN